MFLLFILCLIVGLFVLLEVSMIARLFVINISLDTCCIYLIIVCLPSKSITHLLKMAKKDLMTGIESILGGGNETKKKVATPKKKTTESKSDTSNTIEDNLKIAMDPSAPASSNTHIVPDKLMGKARHIANKEGVSVKDVLNQSLARLITTWEEKNYTITDDMLIAKRSKKTII